MCVFTYHFYNEKEKKKDLFQIEIYDLKESLIEKSIPSMNENLFCTFCFLLQPKNNTAILQRRKWEIYRFIKGFF